MSASGRSYDGGCDGGGQGIEFGGDGCDEAADRSDGRPVLWIHHTGDLIQKCSHSKKLGIGIVSKSLLQSGYQSGGDDKVLGCAKIVC